MLKLQVIPVKQETLLSIEEVTDPKRWWPFVGPIWQPERPTNRFGIAVYRLQGVLKPYHQYSAPLLIRVPSLGLCVIWRLNPFDVLQVDQSGETYAVHDESGSIITLTDEQRDASDIVLDRVIIDPPSWLR